MVDLPDPLEPMIMLRFGPQLKAVPLYCMKLMNLSLTMDPGWENFPGVLETGGCILRLLYSKYF